MAHFIRKALTAALAAGGVYVLYTGLTGSNPDFNFKISDLSIDTLKEAGEGVSESIIQEIGKADYELAEDDMYDEDHDILEGDMALHVLEGISENMKLDAVMGGCVFKLCVSDDDSFMVQAENMGRFQCFVEDSELVLRGSGAVTDLSDMNMQTGEMILYVPENYVFSEACLELGAGSMEIESIRASELKLECGAGMLRVYYADTEDGAFKCSAGSISARLFGVESDYNYTIESAVGMVQIGDESYSGVTASREIRNASEKNIEVECTMGSIKIEF